MLGMIKRDLILMFSSKQERLFFLLYIPFLMLIVDSYDPKYLYLVILITYTYLTSITPFSYDVSSKASYIMNSLPISRREIVVYKYLSVFVYFVLTIVYAGVYLWIINKIGIKNVDYFNFEMIKTAIPIILISISIVFPAYLRFEPKIAQIIHMVVFMTFFIGIVNLANLGDSSIAAYFELISKEIYILLISIAIYILSLLFSMKVYKRRDL